MSDTPELIDRTTASAGVAGTPWRMVMSRLELAVLTADLAASLRVADIVVRAAGAAADDHVALNLRPDRVDVLVQTIARDWLSAADVEIAQSIYTALVSAGFELYAPTSNSGTRPTQAFECAIDALDIPLVRPFWKAVLGYVDKPGDHPVYGGIVDPAGQLPQFWFQQMDAPRPQRNRIHFDLALAHDEVEQRLAAAVAAGGRVLTDEYARAFWVLADPEGNEICLCTWQDRDERGW